MGKNKVNLLEHKTKKDNFFKKPTQSQVRKQQFKSSNNHQNSNSQTSGNFFIKPASDSEKSHAAESTANKKDDSRKKPFDKKKWRLQRYSKKYKLQQWEESRKKAVLKEYYKQTKDDVSPKIDVQKIYKEAEGNRCEIVKADELENENNLNSEITDDTSKSTAHEPPRKKKRPYLNAYQEYQRLKEKNMKRKEEIHKKKEERDKALKEYKKEKTRKFKKLNKKTKKGQPVMKYRMQMLLEQTEKTTK